MKAYTYTKREVQIIRSKRAIEITDEEFLAVYNKAYRRDHFNYIHHLGDVYPEIQDRVFSEQFSEQHRNPADHEHEYPFPIFCPSTRNTEGRIRDMTAYLLGRRSWTKAYQRSLSRLVPYRLVFHYGLDEYVKDYDADALWKNYFKGLDELARMIERRGISNLAELEYRAMEYFEMYLHNFLRTGQKEATDRER